jgi:hypothetical protein
MNPEKLDVSSTFSGYQRIYPCEMPYCPQSARTFNGSEMRQNLFQSDYSGTQLDLIPAI